MRQAAMVNPEFAATLDEMTAGDGLHLLGHLDHLRAAGRALPGRPELVIAMVSGMLDGFAQRWRAVPGREVSDDEVIDALTTFVHRGLNGPSA